MDRCANAFASGPPGITRLEVLGEVYRHLQESLPVLREFARYVLARGSEETGIERKGEVMGQGAVARVLYSAALTTFSLCLSSWAQAGVIINEFLPNPDHQWYPSYDPNVTVFGTDERYHEWVEIYNNSSSSVNISGWRIDDVSGPDNGYFEFSADTTINPYSFIVVYGQEATGTYRLGLSNDGDTVYLKRPSNGSWVTVDSYTYSGGWADPDYSIGRNPDGSGNWQQFSAQDATPGGPVPEPDSLVLLAGGLAVLAGRLRRKRQRKDEAK
ncbi:MAG TPA: PEP-CTERM sorting domain-containing protein [Armatimonadetes bacterium]|nr:PEP-CTERM sorting domain-containing protein [Armatimonadota bacterium]